MRSRINYERLGQAISFYETCGFEYIETPWLVEDCYDAATRPDDGVVNTVFGERGGYHLGFFGSLVASGEQSFIKMMAEGKLVPGQLYQTVTPCFRFLDGKGPINFPNFMKLELFMFHDGEWDWDVSYDTVTKVFERNASECFEDLRVDTVRCDPVYTDTDSHFSLDLSTKYKDGIELGSYGYRTKVIGDECYRWYYGTGLAEPRFSQALELQNATIT